LENGKIADLKTHLNVGFFIAQTSLQHFFLNKVIASKSQSLLLQFFKNKL
jgi:hypothetical protein